jgi:hypothetical protein
MRAISMLVVVPILLVPTGIRGLGAAYSTEEKYGWISQENKTDLPQGRRSRPKLTLENALKIAQTYVRNEEMDSASYWLYQAHFILHGRKAKAEVCELELLRRGYREILG